MRQATLQGIAFAIILAVALCADGLMDTFGPWGFTKYAGGTIAAAGVLVWLSNRLPKRKAAPGAGTSKSGRPAGEADPILHPHYEGAERNCQDD